MGVEIERKFLIRDNSWREQADSGTEYQQAYLVGSKTASVRVRIEGDRAFLNIKSATLGITRQEFEYPIPMDEARAMLKNLCEQPVIDKTRYHLQHEGHTWEIDEFKGDNAGLLVAEIELAHEDEAFVRPDWLGEEVSADPRYYNVCLVKNPYKHWKTE